MPRSILCQYPILMSLSSLQYFCLLLLCCLIRYISIYTGTTKIRLEDVDATSLTLNLGSEEEMSSPSPGNIIHYRVWHRKGHRKITEDMNCALVSPNTRFVISRLTPATEYFFKVVSFRSIKETRVEKNQHLYKNISREETSSSTKEKKLAKKLCLEKAVGRSCQYRFQTEVSDLVWLTRQCR
ncbi:BnaCnng18840D [Brassica napus]|uniref:BnaCnng18840D protein n=1 Tax=Brassica napus TaxID=3708 RepID=A0A078IGV7_BRANA|nr:BnaCnng18840D [Brassica napus]